MDFQQFLLVSTFSTVSKQMTGADLTSASQLRSPLVQLGVGPVGRLDVTLVG